MQEGILKTTLLDSGLFVDADFELAIREGRADELLSQLTPVLELETHNLVFDNFAPYCYFWGGWSAAGQPPDPYHRTSGAGHSWLGFIALLTYDAEPTYTESSNESTGITGHNVAGAANTTSGSKRIVNDQIDDWAIWSEAGGREQITFRNRWLYLPAEGVSASINSLGVYFQSIATHPMSSTGVYRGRAARIRFKDSGGNPITINKTGNQVLLLEYTFSLTSV